MSYSALSLCEILLEHHEMIEQVWKEEPAELTQKRHDFFVKGAEPLYSSIWYNKVIS